MKLERAWDGSVKLELSENETHRWANRQGHVWPCSILSGKTVFAEFAGNGDLVNCRIGHNETAGIPCDEFNALTGDYLSGKIEGDPYLVCKTKEEYDEIVAEELEDARWGLEEDQRKELVWAAMTTGTPDMFSDEMRWFWNTI